MSEVAVRIEPLSAADVASAVELAVRVLRVKAGDRGEQFVADITGEQRQMFVAKVSSQVVAYGRVLELAADEAGPGTPAGYYLSGVLVEPAWRGRGIGTALTRARLRWAFARTGTVFYVTGAGNTASIHLHAALGFQEIKRFASERSPAGVDVLSQLVRSAADTALRPLPATSDRLVLARAGGAAPMRLSARPADGSAPALGRRRVVVGWGRDDEAGVRGHGGGRPDHRLGPRWPARC